MRKRWCALAVMGCMAAGLLSGCGGEAEPVREALDAAGQGRTAGAASGEEAPDGTDAAGVLKDAESMFTDRDRSGDYDPEECVRIELGGGDVTITEEGVYLLSGSAENGMILVDADKSAKIQLVLDNVEISNSQGAAIYVRQADKVFITLAEGSVNTLSGGDSYVSLDDSNIDGVIFAKSDLTINGKGSLSIAAVTGHGIVSKDDLKVAGGTVTVNAPRHGLSGKDSVRIGEGASSTWLNITAGKDGIHSENADKEDKGFVYIEGGRLDIASGDDGLHADKAVAVAGGTIDISICYEGIEGNQVVISGGCIRLRAGDDGLNAAGGSASSLLISGGEIYINADGDGIDSNGTLTVTGGEIYISGPETGANGALDYESGAQITGGTLVALGNSGMAMNFGEASTQGSALITTDYCQAGTEVSLEDGEGNVLVTYTAEKGFNSVAVSCPGMVQGGTYTVRAGSLEYEVKLDSLIYGTGFEGLGGFGGGRPGMPGNGEGPEKPGDGSWPEMPGNGEGPEKPGDGSWPEMPGAGERPEMPEDGSWPEMPGNGERPEMPEDGSWPEMPGNGEMPGAPGEGRTPRMPEGTAQGSAD